jgi:hypothetical protein
MSHIEFWAGGGQGGDGGDGLVHWQGMGNTGKSAAGSAQNTPWACATFEYTG